MLNLLGMKNCKVCEESKKKLSNNNVKFEFMDLTEGNNILLARRFNIKVAGKFLYDDQSDKVIPVDDYINSLKK